MNELQRQAYLSALGIENYMPRWQLPWAPANSKCDLSVLEEDMLTNDTVETQSNSQPIIASSTPIHNPDVSGRLLDDIKTTSVKPVKISAASILQNLEQKPVADIHPFSLSIWRPQPGMLVIDSRDTSLALPVELLLHNILRAFLGKPIASIPEEVLRWPMIENRFVSRTVTEARTELQTWLGVEHDLRPISQLWLMGENAARYFLPENTELNSALWQSHHLPESGLTGFVIPSLNQLLQQPLMKAQLWAAIKNIL